MSYLTLPKRAFNSPLIRYTNFEGGSHINLIRLVTPYANGDSYAIHETTNNPLQSNKLLKTFDIALKEYERMVEVEKSKVKVISEGATGNQEQY